MSATMNVTAAASTRAHPFLLVRVGGESFALPIAEVLEVVDAPDVAPLPLTPEGVAGQCVHRGRLLPVLDAGAVLGVAREGGAGALLVVADGDARFGLLVDDALDMVAVDAAAMRPMPVGAGQSAGVLQAVLSLDRGLAALVDMDVVRANARARLTTEAG